MCQIAYVTFAPICACALVACVREKEYSMIIKMLDSFAIQYDGAICDCWPIDNAILTTSCFSWVQFNKADNCVGIYNFG